MELYTVRILAFWHEHSMRAQEVQKCGEPRLALSLGAGGRPLRPREEGATTAYQDTFVNKSCLWGSWPFQGLVGHKWQLLITHSYCLGGRAGSEQPWTFNLQGWNLSLHSTSGSGLSYLLYFSSLEEFPGYCFRSYTTFLSRFLFYLELKYFLRRFPLFIVRPFSFALSWTVKNFK